MKVWFASLAILVVGSCGPLNFRGKGVGPLIREPPCGVKMRDIIIPGDLLLLVSKALARNKALINWLWYELAP